MNTVTCSRNKIIYFKNLTYFGKKFFRRSRESEDQPY
jgi:hypothetical protein